VARVRPVHKRENVNLGNQLHSFRVLELILFNPKCSVAGVQIEGCGHDLGA